ncbi:MAG: hypothetical protein ABMA64_31600 [Myxococcota bacterium]
MARIGWFVAFAWAMVGCADPISDCVVQVEGVEVCFPNAGSKNHCRDVWGGEAYPSESEAQCEAAGYGEECVGTITNTGQATVQLSYYFTGSAEDCAAVDGATFADLE